MDVLESASKTFRKYEWRGWGLSIFSINRIETSFCRDGAWLLSYYTKLADIIPKANESHEKQRRLMRKIIIG